MIFFKKTFLFILFFLPFCQLYSQEYLFDAKLLTTEDGLTNLMTSSVHKDKNGYLWIGTNAGLNRYDGYNFTSYTQEKNNLHSNNSINQIKEDAAGNLWLYYFSQGGYIPTSFDKIQAIDIFNPQTGKATPFDVFFKNKAPITLKDLHNVRIIDAANRIWLTTKNGDLYLFQKGQFLKIYEQKDTFVQYVTVDKKDNIWIGFNKTITKINLNGVVLETQHLPNDLLGIWTDDTEQLWWASGDWIPEYGKGGFEEKSTIFNTNIWSKKKEGAIFQLTLKKDTKRITPDFKGDFFLHRNKAGYWYAQIDGQLNSFNQEGQFIYNYHDLIGKDLKVGYNNYFETANNELWLPTPLGLLQTKIHLNPFKLINGTELSTDYRGIVETENGTIFFMNKGLFEFNPKNIAPPEKKELDGYFALIYTDSIVWSGTYANRYVATQLDLRTQEKYTYKKANNLSHLVSFATLKTGLPSEYLIGTDRGLCYLNIQKKQIRPFTQYNGFETLAHSEIYHFHKNDSGIWLATNNGVFLMDEKAGILRKYDVASKDLPFNFIRHIYETEEGVFWLATKGGGIIQWQPAEIKGAPSTYRQFTTKDGLSHNATYAIYGDDYGKLWIPSDRGLMYMDAQTYEVNVFLKEDGLPHNEFNLTAHYQAKDGTLYFGGLGGLISFHPKSFEDRLTNNHPLKFVKYQVLEEGATKETNKTKELIGTTNITVEPTDKFLEVQFVLLDFDDPSQHSYAYQIEGYSNQWTYIDENYIRITSLPYGDYRLRIKGRNIGKGWSEEELFLDIKVAKPFYLQSWFIGLGILSLFGFILGGVRWRLQSLQKDKDQLENEVEKRTATIQQQAQKLQALDKAKTRFFSNITHEFRTPLTLVIGPLEQVMEMELPKKNRERLTSVLKNARHLLGLINQLLDLSKLESGKMKIEVTHGDINAYTKELANSIQPLADKKALFFELIIAETAWEIQFDKNKWTKIIYNLLSNAIKYTPERGAIQVELRSIDVANAEQIHLRVKDSGIGIKKKQLAQIFNRFYQVDDSSTRQQEGTGIGLALVKELVELQGGTIEVVSELEKGTTFDIKLPVFEMDGVNEMVTLPIIGIETLPQLSTYWEESIPTKGSMQSKQKEQLEILIIEDNAEMRTYIRDCLDETKYHIIEASNGMEGITKAIAIVPDLIISDVMMPGKNGFEVTETLRSTTTTSHIPIILLTAKSALESRLAGFKSGADVYLTKPFSPQELSLRIQKLIEIRALIRNNISSITATKMKPALTEIKQSYQMENDFVKQVRNIIDKHLNVTGLNGEFIGEQIGMSRMQIHRKLRALINQSASEFIREIRLQKAYEFLRTQNYNSSEVAYQTGFNTLAHFSKTFKEKYGYSPSDLLKKESV